MSFVRMALTSLAVLALTGVQARDAGALDNAAEWIEVLRPIHRGPPADDDRARETPAAAVTVLAFEDRSVRLTARARDQLDALARALTAPELLDYVFEIQWHTAPRRGPTDGVALADGRASAIYEYLQATPGISPGRLMIRFLKRQPEELTDALPKDAVVIKVANLGRED
jgi:outer membrane protein OmpA-like peptidoglycan-associated protein